MQKEEEENLFNAHQHTTDQFDCAETDDVQVAGLFPSVPVYGEKDATSYQLNADVESTEEDEQYVQSKLQWHCVSVGLL